MGEEPKSPKRVLVPIGTGSEEIEAATIIDTLRRATASVTVASVENNEIVKMSRDMKFVADTLITNITDQTFDAIVLPGGMPGAERLRDSKALVELIRRCIKGNGIVAAICAAPAVVLAHHGLMNGKKATCYPANGFKEKIEKMEEGEDVVVDLPFITSKGPGTAMKFAIRVVSQLYSKEKAEQLGKEMLCA